MQSEYKENQAWQVPKNKDDVWRDIAYIKSKQPKRAKWTPYASEGWKVVHVPDHNHDRICPILRFYQVNMHVDVILVKGDKIIFVEEKEPSRRSLVDYFNVCIEIKDELNDGHCCNERRQFEEDNTRPGWFFEHKHTIPAIPHVLIYVDKDTRSKYVMYDYRMLRELLSSDVLRGSGWSMLKTTKHHPSYTTHLVYPKLDDDLLLSCQKERNF